ncbi:flagellar basal body-associated FliL family protein [Teredinibacter haidensis]|uniref:flagellar basal body-associated FliL family protein n=1 Tax=Teredinibacter haidensis TaxID=2731755 RepID=UPI000948D1FB|nr:flagellar basal body-associated FliL family protein [Teredinibacter haidensis]
MADEDENGNEQSEDGAEGGGKKKLILLIVLALIIAGISVGGTLAALKFFAPSPQELADGNTEEVEPPPIPAIYYPIKPAIIVNFDVKGRQRYLQAELTLLIRDDDVVSAVELHMPKVRNGLNLLIGGQLYEELQTAEGKELLRQQCLQELQRIMQEEIGKPGVEMVLFTNFVMQ